MDSINSVLISSLFATNAVTMLNLFYSIAQGSKQKNANSNLSKGINLMTKMVELNSGSKEIIEQLELTTLLFNSSGDSIIVTNNNGDIIEANPAYYRSTGFKPQDVIGCKFWFNSTQKKPQKEYSELLEQVERKGVVIKEVYSRKVDQSIFPESKTITAIMKNGIIDNYVIISRDISEQKEREGNLIKAAKRDKLTGIMNREGFEDRLLSAIELQENNEESYQVGVLFLDLDEFKPVNDTYGHDVGDQLLIAVADRIQSKCEDFETTARLGGDEFVCIFPVLKGKDELKEKADKVLNSLNKPVGIEGISLPVKCSIGAALYPEDATNVEELLKASDVAMYQAKTAGKNQIRIYDPAFKSQEQEYEELSVALMKAASNNELKLAFHPIFDSSNSVYCYDVLLRWELDGYGAVPPKKFISIAEKYGIMSELYDFTLRTLAFDKKVKKLMSQGVLFSIKLEESAIKSQTFGEQFISKIDNLNLERSAMVVRVDEQVVATNFKSALSNINHFEDREIKVCLDDFCIGNFSILNRVNLRSTLAKLPRELVRELIENNNKLHLLNSVFALASAMNTVVVVEGIEDKRSFDLFTEHGVMYVQGNYLSKAIYSPDLPERP